MAGRAVIQTYQPQNKTINFAKEQNYIDFYDNEIFYRSKMEYPPFSDIVYILVSGEDDSVAEVQTIKIEEMLEEEQKHNRDIIKIIGPAPAPIYKIKNKYRYRILIKVINSESIHSLLSEIHKQHENSRQETSLIIDINPTNML